MPLLPESLKQLDPAWRRRRLVFKNVGRLPWHSGELPRGTYRSPNAYIHLILPDGIDGPLQLWLNHEEPIFSGPPNFEVALSDADQLPALWNALPSALMMLLLDLRASAVFACEFSTMFGHRQPMNVLLLDIESAADSPYAGKWCLYLHTMQVSQRGGDRRMVYIDSDGNLRDPKTREPLASPMHHYDREALAVLNDMLYESGVL